jgi:protein-S-isoprenylcysteine O-methyltransferase Ste14
MWTGAITRLENHQLKTSGPYMIARHPLYLSLIIAVLCIFLMTGNSILTFGFGIFVAFSVVRYRKEERLLIQMFGDEYRRYMRRVGPFWPNLCAKEDIEFNVEARESSPLVLEPAAPARLDVSS